MKRKTWIHTALHLGCVALLLLQGYRIQEMYKKQVALHTSDTAVRQTFAEMQKSLMVCNERCGWNKGVEDVYGRPKPPSLKEQ